MRTYHLNEVKKVCVLIFLTLFLTSNPYLSDSEYYCYEFNLFKQWFTEPVESAYFYWANGTVLKFTSYEWNTISCNVAQAVEEIERRGYAVNALLFIIHNHMLPAGFSANDAGFYAGMKRHGFSGMFLLYYNGTTSILREQE